MTRKQQHEIDKYADYNISVKVNISGQPGLESISCTISDVCENARALCLINGTPTAIFVFDYELLTNDICNNPTLDYSKASVLSRIYDRADDNGRLELFNLQDYLNCRITEALGDTGRSINAKVYFTDD